ncbi:protein eiger [Cimex lectularius]|uniref:THD domain-containing protein n=1 Tax=Cimex lectularius TaxID=79782 RepID=A0A8I6S155_CIMLE|nr:protein eiger [Cimex lectularius]
MEGQGKFSALYLIIALAASLILSIAIAYLEVKRDTEIRELANVVESLIQDVKSLKSQLENVKNQTSFLVEQFDKIEEDMKDSQNYTTGDEDEYYEDEYDDDGDESRKKRHAGHYSKRSVRNLDRTKNDLRAGSEEDSVIKHTYSNSSPAPLLATIFLESDGYKKQQAGPLEHTFPPKMDSCDYSKCMKNVVAHYEGNSSAARKGHHRHYDSNHRMYHPNGVIREWTKAAWVPNSYLDPTLYFDNGEVKLTDYPGLYYVYAQVFYADPHDTTGFRIYVNDEVVMQCTITAHGVHRSGEAKRNSCYTGGLVKLNVDDKISIKEVEGTRYTIFEHTKSFFGLFRVAAM